LHDFPLKRGLVEEVEPEFRALDSDQEVRDAYLAWADCRRDFNAALKQPGSEAQAKKWQKDYFRGRASYETAPRDHRTRLRLAEFKPAR
jgi:Family of unknown function (DUF6065)